MQYKRAMVTGASSGIGKAFAELLAEEGSDLVVVARNRQRLNDLAIQLRTRFRCEIEILDADLENPNQLAQIESRLRDRDDIDLLVNNAGYGHAGGFARLPIEQSMGQIECNVRALTRLAHAALQSMTTARRGAILNVASGAAFLPTPGLAVYAATKAYVLSFTQALHEEVRGDGVTVSVVCPGFTRTEFQQRAGYDTGSIPGFAWQSAEQVAREALAALRARKVICVPGIQNKLTMGVVNLVPRSAIAGLVGRMTRQ